MFGYQGQEDPECRTYTLELFLSYFKSVMPLLLQFPITLLQFSIQRKRDDNKNKICTFQGGVGRGGREENCPQRYFSWETPRQ